MRGSIAVRFVLLGVFTVEAGAVEPMPRIDFPDVPAEQIPIDQGLPGTKIADGNVEVHAAGDGSIVVLSLEGRRVRAQRSLDGGATFGGEVEIFGGNEQRQAQSFASAFSEGVTYVVAAVLDPSGGIGLQLRRSSDMGQTWSAAVDLVAYGDPYHDVAPLARSMFTVGAGPGGKVGVVFARDYYGFLYATVSSDTGATWTTPTRIDAGATAPLGGSYPTPTLAFAPDGKIHVAYADSRTVGSSSYFYALMYTRSVDGGATFEPERQLANRGREPDIAIGADGSVLIAGCDGTRVVVLRSTNGGSTFSTFTSASSGATFRFPTLLPSPASGTVLVAATAVDNLGSDSRFGALHLMRSTNYGASFGASTILATRAARAVPGLSRSASGIWSLAWTDARSDGYVGMNTDVYASSSADDGATWSAAVRVDGDAAGAAPSTLRGHGAAVTPSGTLVLAYADGRDAPGSANVRVNRSPVHPLSFGPDARIDVADTPGVPPCYDQDLAADGASGVYVAFPAGGPVPYTSVYVAASLDFGRTFGPARDATPSWGGSRLVKMPKVLARPDGRVYVVFVSVDPAGGSREIRLARSSDFGGTWSPQPTLVGIGAHVGPPTTWALYPEFDEVQAELLDGDGLVVAWTDRFNIRVARSTDDGATFSVGDIDGQVGTGDHTGPSLCGRGDALTLVFGAVDPSLAINVPWGTVSTNGGVTWSTPVRLEGVAESVGSPRCAASPGSDVFAVWTDYRGADPAVFGTRWTGTAWESSRPVLAVPGVALFGPQAVYTGAGNIVVTAGEPYLARSTDGGATFGAPQRLDLDSPVPEATSYTAGVASDGSGRVWVSWLDRGAAVNGSQVVRYSPDHGASFGPVLRLNRDVPQGHLSNYGWYVEFPGDVAAGAFLMAFQQERSAGEYGIVVNAHDPSDLDRDGADGGGDCDDADPSVETSPSAVTGLTVATVAGGVRLAWDSQAETAGRGTVHDVADGTLSSLRSTSGYGGAGCLESGTPASTLDDTRPAPPSGEGIWYRVRARNACGVGPFGAAGLDATPPCP